VPVCNRAPRSPRARAELARAFAALAEGFLAAGQLSAPLPVGHHRGVEEALRDGVRLPPGLGRPLLAAVDAVVARSPRAGGDADLPRRRPLGRGSLGTFTDPLGPDRSDDVAAG
jgi:hypothetical protein